MRPFSYVAAVCVLSASLIAAENPFIGTWKLNTAKSKGTPGTIPKEQTVVFSAVGDQITRTGTGIDADGEPLKVSATFAWDGQDHPVEAPNRQSPVMVAVTFDNDRRIDVTVKRPDGKVVSSGHTVVSKDGKTMTATYKGQDPKGRQVNNVEVFDKQ